MTDHNGNSPWQQDGFAPAALDDYLDLLDDAITQAVANGCVALKSALAYDRRTPCSSACWSQRSGLSCERG
jgi:hypothetical protein